jgi:IPT/TIG domain
MIYNACAAHNMIGSKSRFWVVIALLVASACLTDVGSGSLAPAELSRVATSDQQEGPAGGRLPAPLRVTIRTADGSLALRAQVQWVVTSSPGGGALSDEVTVSDGLGIAQVALTLGGEGTYTVTATLVVDPTKTAAFTAVATPAPTLSSISTTTIAGGDIVTLTGDHLTDETAFEFSSVPAMVVGPVSATSVDVSVPECLTPGATDVRAVLLGAASAPVSATFTATAPALTLAAGEYVAVRPEDVDGCATLPSAPSGGAQYLIAPQSVSAQVGESTPYRIRSGGATPLRLSQREVRPRTTAQRFHDFLREQEHTLPTAPLPRAALEGAAPTVGVVVGEQRDFVVCRSVPCPTVKDFANVRAVAKYVGQRAAIYQDVDAPSGGFTASDFSTIGDIFDQQLYAIDTEAFGAESDVDNNGLVVILMSPVVNALTSADECATSYITGFFFSVDINPMFARDARSNQGEVFYSLVPDPNGKFSCRHSTSDVRQTVPVTFVHEFQHMINYYQHALLRGGPQEETWLNEAMSHLAEELGGLRFREQGDSASFSRFAIGDITNAYDFLTDPSEVTVLFGDGTGTLVERGAAWLFLRWLVDQFGPGLPRRLSETSRTGAANVAAATGEPFDRLLSQWFLANWVSDLPSFTAPARLRYTTWAFRTTFASLHDQAPNNYPRVYPLIPVQVGTAFDVPGVLRAGSGEYYLLTQSNGAPGVALEFVSSTGAPLTGAAAPRLNILRIR